MRIQSRTSTGYMRKSTPRFASISFPNFRRNASGSSSVFRKSASACLGQGEFVENVSAERDKNHLNCTKSQLENHGFFETSTNLPSLNSKKSRRTRGGLLTGSLRQARMFPPRARTAKTLLHRTWPRISGPCQNLRSRRTRQQLYCS